MRINLSIIGQLNSIRLNERILHPDKSINVMPGWYRYEINEDATEVTVWVETEHGLEKLATFR